MYSKNTWVDRNVQYPNRYTDELGSTKTFTASPGTITAAGTQITAARMNNLEYGLSKSHDGTHIFGSSATGNDSYVLTFSPALASYNTGLIINIKVDVANTGTATLNINGLGAKNLKKVLSTGKTDLVTGDLWAGNIYILIYDGTDFIVTNPNKLPALGSAYQHLGVNSGETGIEWQESVRSLSDAEGDIVFATDANELGVLNIGSNGEVLTVVDGRPAWIDNQPYVIEPSDNVLLEANTERYNSNSNSTLKVKTFTVKYGGCYRLKVDNMSEFGTHSIAQYDVVLGSKTLISQTGISSENTNSYVTYTVDLVYIPAGATINIYVNNLGGDDGYVRNAKICGTPVLCRDYVVTN